MVKMLQFSKGVSRINVTKKDNKNIRYLKDTSNSILERLSAKLFFPHVPVPVARHFCLICQT